MPRRTRDPFPHPNRYPVFYGKKNSFERTQVRAYFSVNPLKFKNNSSLKACCSCPTLISTARLLKGRQKEKPGARNRLPMTVPPPSPLLRTSDVIQFPSLSPHGRNLLSGIMLRNKIEFSEGGGTVQPSTGGGLINSASCSGLIFRDFVHN